MSLLLFCRLLVRTATLVVDAEKAPLAHSLVHRAQVGLVKQTTTVGQAYISDITTPAERTGDFALMTTVVGIGFVVGPAFGSLFARIHLRLPFFVAAALFLLDILCTVFFLKDSTRPADPTAVAAASTAAAPAPVAVAPAQVPAPAPVAMAPVAAPSSLPDSILRQRLVSGQSKESAAGAGGSAPAKRIVIAAGGGAAPAPAASTVASAAASASPAAKKPRATLRSLIVLPVKVQPSIPCGPAFMTWLVRVAIQDLAETMVEIGKNPLIARVLAVQVRLEQSSLCCWLSDCSLCRSLSADGGKCFAAHGAEHHAAVPCGERSDASFAVPVLLMRAFRVSTHFV